MLSSIIGNPWALLVCFAVGFGSGWQVNGWRHDSQQVAAIEKQEENHEHQAVIIDDAAMRHEEDKVRIETQIQYVTKEVQKIVEKPIYHNVCFDADGLRELHSAISGAAEAASEPATALPGPVRPN